MNWAKAYYFGNSGRIIIHSLLIIILNLPVDIFRILSSIMVVVTCMGIYQIINVRKKSNDLVRFLIISIIFCGMFFAINNLGGIIRWASGALNYLYPVSAMLFVCIFVWKYGIVISSIDGFRNVDIYIHKIPKKEL